MNFYQLLNVTRGLNELDFSFREFSRSYIAIVKQLRLETNTVLGEKN